MTHSHPRRRANEVRPAPLPTNITRCLPPQFELLEVTCRRSLGLGFEAAPATSLQGAVLAVQAEEEDDDEEEDQPADDETNDCGDEGLVLQRVGRCKVELAFAQPVEDRVRQWCHDVCRKNAVLVCPMFTMRGLLLSVEAPQCVVDPVRLMPSLYPRVRVCNDGVKDLLR